MALHWSIYITVVFLNTIIVLVNALIIWAAVKTREVFRNIIILTIVTNMIIDIFLYFNLILHDLPSFIMNRDISKQTQFLSVFVNCTEWFVQLLMLPLLSIMHFVAMYWPTTFRGLSFRQFAFCNAGTVLVAMSSTIPLFTQCCGFTYYIETHSWYFDFSKPYSDLYRIVNLYLQGVCVVFIVITDTLIVWKVYYLRRSGRQAIVLAPQHAFAKRRENSREVQLVKNFLLLSICFLLMTICFNLHLEYSFWMDLATRSTILLNLAKWSIYGLGNPVIRTKVLHPFRTRKSITMPTSALTRI